MKTLVIVLTVLVYSMALSAQITLEHTYSYSGTLAEIDEDEFKYFIMDVPMKQCRIYNEDHSLYKNINLSVPQGYFLSDIKYVSRKTFNADDNIELLYIYSNSAIVNSKEVYTYGMKVINEFGNVLMTLQDGAFAEIREVDGESKLLAYQYIYDESYYLVNTNIYCLGGEPSNNTTMKSSPSLRIYPNPAVDLVHVEMTPRDMDISGHVIISDLSGKQLLDQSYDPGLTKIPVATDKLGSGGYILNVRMDNGASLAGKIIKN